MPHFLIFGRYLFCPPSLYSLWSGEADAPEKALQALLPKTLNSKSIRART